MFSRFRPGGGQTDAQHQTADLYVTAAHAYNRWSVMGGIMSIIIIIMFVYLVCCVHTPTYKTTRQSELANTSPRHMPVLGNVHPIKIENLIFFRDVISLLARVVILLTDTATQEVPIKNIWKKLSVQFLRYAIELLHVKRRTRHKWR